MSLIETGDPSEAPVILDARVVVGAGGGPDKTILNSPRFLAPHYRMLCAYMHAPDDSRFDELRRRADRLQAPLLSIPDRGPWDWTVVTQFLRICRREQVSVWHGHDYKSNALGLLLRRFWPMRLVTTVHGWVQQTRRMPLYYWIDRLCLGHYERVLCVSQDLHQQSLACGVAPERCLLIENGIDLEAYSRKRRIDEAKHQLGVPAGRLLLGAVGRLSAEKGFDLLIQAVDRLIREGVNVELVIAGEGGHEAELRALISRLGRQDRIRLLGYRSDTTEIYQALDVFALSSLREGLPNVVLEAMAFEVPVVATQVAGVPRVVQHRENGLLVNPGSVEELAAALAQVVADGALRRRLGQAARKTVEMKYNFRTRMHKIKVLYDELLGRESTGFTRSNGLAGSGGSVNGNGSGGKQVVQDVCERRVSGSRASRLPSPEMPVGAASHALR